MHTAHTHTQARPVGVNCARKAHGRAHGDSDDWTFYSISGRGCKLYYCKMQPLGIRNSIKQIKMTLTK